MMSETVPAAWRWHAEGEVRWTFGAYAPSDAFVKQPLYALSACRDEIYEIVLRELETKHPIPTTVLLATRITNALTSNSG
jgi:hypothetical protein